MQKLTGLERLLKTIKLQEPDVVPHFEALIDKKVRDAILPHASYEDFVEYMDLDGIVVFDKTSTWSYETLSQNTKRDQWGGIVRFTTEETGHPMIPAIKAEKDLDSYVPPDPDEDWRYERLEQLVKRFKGQRAIIAHVTDVFDVAKESLLGDVAYFRAMIRNPELVQRVNELVVDYHLRFIRNCIDVGADVVLVTGDWATAKAPMVSPAFTKRFISPYFQRIVECAHDRGVPCLKHTDGNIWPIFHIIIEAGADGIHPIDPTAGMDIGEAKAKFGDRVCLMGNVNCATTLCSGTVEEVRQETREVIRKAGKRGGLICMSSNSVHSGVRPEDYVAMVKAIREYGKYPLEDHFNNLVVPGSIK